MKKIAILTGGPGYEREVAIRSSKLFEKYLNQSYQTFIFPEEKDLFVNNRDDFDIVIPVFHGEYGEDGKIFAFLDILGKKYPFSTSEVHSFCLNKFLTNTFLENFGYKVGKQILIDEHEQHNLTHEKIYEKHKENIEELGYPFIMKPTHGGSSFYTYKIDSVEDFLVGLASMRGNIKDSILLQEFIVGEEYSVSIVGGRALPHIMKVDKKAEEVFDYTLKYESDVELFPEIQPSLKAILMKQAEDIFSKLWCRSIARVDFIVRDSVAYFLEINTIPGMTEVSILPKAWKLSGKTLEEFVEVLLSDI